MKLFFPKSKKKAPFDNGAIVDSQFNKLGEVGIFHKKEIETMPRLKDLRYRFRKDNVHEFRYRKGGIEKSFSSKDLAIAKRKALDFCRTLNNHEKSLFYKNDSLFIQVAEDYLFNVKKKNVTEKSFDVYFNRYEKHIKPAFKDSLIAEIKAPALQKFLNGILEKGFKRTAEDCYYLFKTIFQYAVDNDVISKSPLSAVKIPLHQRENGKALPLEVERKFVSSIAGNKYQFSFLILLYSGVRPCELETLCFEKPGFVTFRNRKQKNGKIAFKDIPITPKLAPYVEEIKKALPLPKTTELPKIFSALCPGFRMYDLRHTFATRCQECGVPLSVVGRWMGHASDKITDSVYTHFSENFMLEQAKKVDY